MQTVEMFLHKLVEVLQGSKLIFNFIAISLFLPPFLCQLSSSNTFWFIIGIVPILMGIFSTGLLFHPIVFAFILNSYVTLIISQFSMFGGTGGIEIARRKSRFVLGGIS